MDGYDFNKMFNQFITYITTQNNVVKKSLVNRYITKWWYVGDVSIEQRYSYSCDICNLVMPAIKKYSQDVQICTYVIHEFGRRVPHNELGVVLTWLYMLDVFEEIGLNVSLALCVCPFSVLSHYIIGSCSCNNTLCGNNIMIMCDVWEKVLLEKYSPSFQKDSTMCLFEDEEDTASVPGQQSSDEESIMWDDSDSSAGKSAIESDCMDDDSNDEDLTEMDKTKCTSPHKVIKKVPDKCIAHVFLDKCIGFFKQRPSQCTAKTCVVKETGECDAQFKDQVLHDIRVLVEPQWVTDNTEYTYHEFVSLPQAYRKYIPGVCLPLSGEEKSFNKQQTDIVNVLGSINDKHYISYNTTGSASRRGRRGIKRTISGIPTRLTSDYIPASLTKKSMFDMYIEIYPSVICSNNSDVNASGNKNTNEISESLDGSARSQYEPQVNAISKHKRYVTKIHDQCKWLGDVLCLLHGSTSNAHMIDKSIFPFCTMCCLSVIEDCLYVINDLNVINQTNMKDLSCTRLNRESGFGQGKATFGYSCVNTDRHNMSASVHAWKNKYKFLFSKLTTYFPRDLFYTGHEDTESSVVPQDACSASMYDNTRHSDMARVPSQLNQTAAHITVLTDIAVKHLSNTTNILCTNNLRRLFTMTDMKSANPFSGRIPCPLVYCYIITKRWMRSTSGIRIKKQCDRLNNTLALHDIHTVINSE